MNAFPFIPVKGESFFSLISRYMINTAGNKGLKLSRLGLGRAESQRLVPTGLPEFPAGHPWRDNYCSIVQEHSLLPFYLYFMPPHEAYSIVERVKPGSIHPRNMLGLARRGELVGYQYGRYCHSCVQEDIARFGHAVGYVSHAPLAIRFCHKHRARLRPPVCSFCVGRLTIAGRDWRGMGTCLCELPEESPLEDHNVKGHLVWLAQQVHSISQPRALPNTDRRALLKSALLARGFGSNQSVSRTALATAVQTRYGDLLLQSLGLSVRGVSYGAFDTQSRAPNPIIYILLAGLVTESVTALDDVETPGEPPIFVGPPQALQSKQFNPRAKELTADNALKLLETHHWQYTKAAKSMSMSFHTFLIRLRDLRVRLPLPASFCKRHGEKLILDIQTAIDAGERPWRIGKRLGLPFHTVLLIQLDRPSAYVPGREADKTFAKSMPPSAKKNFSDRSLNDALGAPPHQRQPKMSPEVVAARWKERDAELLLRLPGIAEAMRSKVPPLRITKTTLHNEALGRQAGHYIRNRRCLPLSMECVERLIDTGESFFRRKLMIVAAELKLHNVAASNRTLARRGIRGADVQEHRELLVKVLREMDVPTHQYSPHLRNVQN